MSQDPLTPSTLLVDPLVWLKSRPNKKENEPTHLWAFLIDEKASLRGPQGKSHERLSIFKQSHPWGLRAWRNGRATYHSSRIAFGSTGFTAEKSMFWEERYVTNSSKKV